MLEVLGTEYGVPCDCLIINIEQISSSDRQEPTAMEDRVLHTEYTTYKLASISSLLWLLRHCHQIKAIWHTRRIHGFARLFALCIHSCRVRSSGKRRRRGQAASRSRKSRYAKRGGEGREHLLKDLGCVLDQCWLFAVWGLCNCIVGNAMLLFPFLISMLLPHATRRRASLFP